MTNHFPTRSLRSFILSRHAKLRRKKPRKPFKCFTPSSCLQKRQKPVRKRSAHQTRLMAQYRKQELVFLDENLACECCGNMATQVHHRAGRLGKNLLDEKTWTAICSRCHYVIHANPAWSYEQGWMIKRNL